MNSFETTDRKERVYRLLQQGYKRQAIADMLYVSLSTMKRSIAEIYRELGVHTREEFLKKTN